MDDARSSNKKYTIALTATCRPQTVHCTVFPYIEAALYAVWGLEYIFSAPQWLLRGDVVH